MYAKVRSLRWLLLLLPAFLVSAGSALAQWSPVTSAFPSGNPDTCLLLTDGSVMCHEINTNRWHRLTPDINGSYANGSWDVTPIAAMPNGTDTTQIAKTGATCSPCVYAPLYYASQVLADGRVVVIGGEYNTNGNTWTYIGFLYNPATNTWSSQLSQPWGTSTLKNGDIVGNIGDSQSVVLQNGTMLIANTFSSDMASFNPTTLTFTSLNPTGKNDGNDEEGWTILPNGTLLSVDAGTGNSFQIYNPTTNAWGSTGTTAGVNLSDTNSTCASDELGPAVMRPDGTIVHFTGNIAGQNAVYNISTGTWSHPSGVDFPVLGGKQYGSPDAPASLLPNGNVLVQASPDVCTPGSGSNPPSIFNTPSHFFEWNGSTLTQVADAPNASSFISYQGRMLLLPTGEVLFTAFNQNTKSPVVDIELYSNGGSPQNSWRPVITTAPAFATPNHSYSISGMQFNGFSLGASYGDDAQMSTNYPLVRIVNNATHHVFYAKTHDHSRMGVEAVGDTSIQSTTFDVPAAAEYGPSQLFVVTNGIPSLPFSMTVAFLPPTISKSFGAASIPLGTNTTLSFTVANPNLAGQTLTGVGFSDTLPAGLTASGVSGSCGGGTITVLSGSIVLSGATLAGATSCTFSTTITGATPGVKMNVTGNVASTEGGPGNTYSATLVVIAPPVISKSFAPAKILPGGSATVSFSIVNPNSFAGLTGVAFTDTLPTGLIVATPNGLTSTCGGTATATAGSSTISLSGGSLTSSASCTVSATVTAPEGVYPNSVQVTSTNGGTGNTSSTTLFAATPPHLTKAFGELSIGALSSTTLSFTLMNPNHVVTLHGLAFLDTLPAGLLVSTPNGLTGTCGGGVITAAAGTNILSLAGATLAPQASCTFSINVTSDGTVLGYLTNTTSTVTSTEALPGAAASATIFIGNPFQITYAANLGTGESYIDITNTGTSGAALLGPGFGAAAGNICVNVYAFDPGEELVACCSCLVTPDQTLSLGVNRDLTTTTLTGVLPTSVTIKLLSTLAGPSGSASSCPQSAATVSTATLANGMAGWSTRLHATPTAGSFDTSETAFIGATLSAGELASIGGRCASILGNGSGFGVCNSCRAGAAGASKLAQ